MKKRIYSDTKLIKKEAIHGTRTHLALINYANWQIFGKNFPR